MDAGVVQLDNSQYSSLNGIFGVALPAIILNAAAPVTAVVQTALLGRYVGTAALGAFGAVSITAGFATRVFNFLVDGVSAKTGQAVGKRAWGQLGGRVKMALGFALVAGVVASVTLALMIQPVSVTLLKLSDEVQAEARMYWRLRVALVPVLLLNMALSGILQGFRHVRVSAVINTGQAVLEMTGSAAVLAFGINVGQADGLLAMGIVTLVTQFLALLTGLCCILTLPPPEAAGQFSLLEDWFGARGAGLKRPVDRGGDSDDDLRQPLMQHDSVESFHKIVGNGAGRKCNGDSAGKLLTTSFEEEGSLGSGSSAVVVVEVSPVSPVSPDVVLLDGGASNDTELGSEGRVRLLSDPGSGEQVQGGSGADAGSRGGGSSSPPPNAGAAGSEDANEALLDFVKDGFNMFVRSMILQTSFFMALAAASRLGTASLAAHSVVSQLWVLISYAVDGFAAAGIVLGSRLAAQAHDPLQAADAKHHLQLLINRVLDAGLLAGIAAGAIFAAWRDGVIAVFTSDPEAIAVLKGGTWLVLCLAQPINGLVFVFDGLLYASQSFRFIRNYILAGFVLVFCPMLAAEMWGVQQLWVVWAANAAINTWRAAGAAYLIFFLFMREFDAQLVPHPESQGV